jgi:hypothetical protein
VDGIFWISLTDFFLNFEQIFLCRSFDNTWSQITYESGWNAAKDTAGGCSNFDSFGKNPQLRINVKLNDGYKDCETFISLSVKRDIGQIQEKLPIGFEVYKCV